MFPVIRLLGFTLPVAPVFAVLAFYMSSELGAQVLGRMAPAPHREKWRELFTSAAFMAGAVGLLGARIGYAAQHYPLYLASPQLLLSIRPGTLALLPGLLAGGAILLFYLHHKDIALATIADAVAIGATGALAVFSLRNFLTGNDYGAPTTLPWGVNLWLTTRHPVQLYEMVFLLVVLVILWQYHPLAWPGETFWLFIALYSLIELFVEAFRANVSTWFMGVREVQVIALTILLLALYILSFYVQRHGREVIAVQQPAAEALGKGEEA